MSPYSTPSMLRLKQVKHATGLGGSTIYDYVKRGLFPRPYKLGERSVGWLASEVFDWITGRDVVEL